MDIALPTDLHQDLSNLINAINKNREEGNKINIDSVSPSELQKALFDYLVYEYIDPENEVSELNTLAKVFYNVNMHYKDVSREDDPVMSFQSSNKPDTLDYIKSYDYSNVFNNVRQGYADSYYDYHRKNLPTLATNEALSHYNDVVDFGYIAGVLGAEELVIDYLAKEMFEGEWGEKPPPDGIGFGEISNYEKSRPNDQDFFSDTFLRGINNYWKLYKEDTLNNNPTLEKFIDICRKIKENILEDDLKPNLQFITDLQKEIIPRSQAFQPPKAEQAPGQTEGGNEQLNENNTNQPNKNIMTDNTNQDTSKTMIEIEVDKILLKDLLNSQISKPYFQVIAPNRIRTPEANNYEFLDKALRRYGLSVSDTSVTVEKALECLENAIERTVVDAGDIQSGDRQKYQNARNALSISLTAYSVISQEQQQSPGNFPDSIEVKTTEVSGGGSQVNSPFPKLEDEGNNLDNNTTTQAQQQNGTDSSTQTPQQNGSNGKGGEGNGGDNRPILKKNKIVNLGLHLFGDFGPKTDAVSDLLEGLKAEQAQYEKELQKAQKKCQQEREEQENKIKGNKRSIKKLLAEIEGLKLNIENSDSPNLEPYSPSQEKIEKLYNIREDARNNNIVLEAVQQFVSGEKVAERGKNETNLEALRRLAKEQGDIPQYNDLSIKNNEQYLTNAFKKLVDENFDISRVTDAYKLPGKDGNLVICYKNEKGKEEWFTNGKARFAVESGKIYEGGPGKLEALKKDKVMDDTGKQIEKNNKIIKSVDDALRQYGHLEGNGQDNNQPGNGVDSIDLSKSQTPGPQKPKVTVAKAGAGARVTIDGSEAEVSTFATASTSSARNVNDSSITTRSGEKTSNQTIETDNITKKGQTPGGQGAYPYSPEMSVLEKYANPNQGRPR